MSTSITSAGNESDVQRQQMIQQQEKLSREGLEDSLRSGQMVQQQKVGDMLSEMISVGAKKADEKAKDLGH